MMNLEKKTFNHILLPLLSPLLLLTLLLAACGNPPSTGSQPTPSPASTSTPQTTPTPQTAPMPETVTSCPAPNRGRAAVMRPLLLGPDQNLVYADKDSANVWHLRRYNTRTGQKTDIYTTEAGQIKESQVSADGQWVLFLADLYPAMRTETGAKVQMIRMDGQGLQTLYCAGSGKVVQALEWSPDQRYIAFQEDVNVYLFNIATGNSQLAVPGSNGKGFAPRTWLDNTHLYLSPYEPAEIPPLNLYLLDIKTMHVQQVLALPTLGGDFDSSIDGTRLFICQYNFGMPTSEGPSSIESLPATGGQATTIYSIPTYAIVAMRVASNSSLLFVIHNTGVSNVDSSHNGLWKVNTDGTGLTRLTHEASDQLTQFATYTQYVWTSISRNGSFYAVKMIHTTSPNAPASLLVAAMNGGTSMTVTSTDSASTLEIVGWTKM